jgi:acyl carrier protein
MTQGPTETALRDWLLALVASYLDLSPAEIDAEAPLPAYGVDSIYALTIIADIEDQLHIALEPELIWDYPTIGTLSAFLHATIQPTSSECAASDSS